MSFQLGQRAGYEAIEHRQPLGPLLDKAVATRHTAPGAALLGGLLEVMCSVLDACQRKSIGFDMSDEAKAIATALPQARRLMMTSLCQHIDQNVADVLSQLNGAIYSVRDVLTLSAPPAVSPEQPVMRMEIVGMPERTTLTTFARDQDGELIESNRRESDSNR